MKPGRLGSAAQALLVAFACLASGTLECGGRETTATELHGAVVYERMCAVCHGPHGEGYAADRAPAIANPSFLSLVNDHFINTAIGNGRTGTTMSAWSNLRGGPLAYKDIEALVAYLRTYDTRPHPQPDDGASKGDAKRGAAEFGTFCSSCHGDHGTGGPYVSIGNGELLTTAGNGLLRTTIRDGREGTLMPSFRAELGAPGIEDVVAALRLWQSQAPATPRTPPPKPPPLPLGPVPLNPKGPEPTSFRTPNTPADSVKHELDRGARMAILDARAPSDYMNEHIAGAVSVPFYDPDPYVSQLPRDTWLVCYCSCPHAESGQLAHKLTDKGFAKVTVLDEGLNVWRSRKYPTASGVDP